MPCFPDDTCDPGLQCEHGRCVSATQGRDASSESPVDGPLRADVPAGCIEGPPPPTLGELPPSTSHQTIPVQGEAHGAARVLVTGGATAQVADVADGTFCLEVALMPGTVNHLEVVGVDAEGCAGQPAVVEVAQEEAAQKNLLLGLEGVSSDEPKVGHVRLLTDGMTAEAVTFWFYDLSPQCDLAVTVSFELEAEALIREVRVKYPAGPAFKHFLACWALLVSTEEAPPSPDPTAPGWMEVARSEDETSDAELVIPVQGASARHLALMMYQDGKKSLWETFDLLEVEAWGALGAPAPRCP